MKSLYDYIVAPSGDRYNNSIGLEDGKSLILNTEVYNHQYINRVGLVKEIPLLGPTPVMAGDEVTIHHNVFRRWHDMKGREKNSRSFVDDNTYIVSPDQVFLYRRPAGEWKVMPGYCFIQPLVSDNRFSLDVERPLVGTVKYSDGSVEEGSLVGFTPGDEFEFVVDGERMYRVMSKYINIQYEHQGNEEAYNPSWAHGS